MLTDTKHRATNYLLLELRLNAIKRLNKCLQVVFDFRWGILVQHRQEESKINREALSIETLDSNVIHVEEEL